MRRYGCGWRLLWIVLVVLLAGATSTGTFDNTFTLEGELIALTDWGEAALVAKTRGAADRACHQHQQRCRLSGSPHIPPESRS
jgi:hypothetical protein